MTKMIFNYGANDYEYHIYESNETIADYSYPILVVYADNNSNFIEPFLYRKLSRIENISDLEQNKFDFLFIFPIKEKGQLNILEETLRKVITFSDLFYF